MIVLKDDSGKETYAGGVRADNAATSLYLLCPVHEADPESLAISGSQVPSGLSFDQIDKKIHLGDTVTCDPRYQGKVKAIYNTGKVGGKQFGGLGGYSNELNYNQAYWFEVEIKVNNKPVTKLFPACFKSEPQHIAALAAASARPLDVECVCPSGKSCSRFTCAAKASQKFNNLFEFLDPSCPEKAGMRKQFASPYDACTPVNDRLTPASKPLKGGTT
jgi:hypothetical protein